MRLFLSAGEASGDALGAQLLANLRLKNQDIQALGMGGELLRGQGLEVLKDSQEVAVFGLVEVVKHLPRLFRLVDELARRAIEARPDVAVLIDVPDFHIRLAKRLKAAGIPVVTYVGPSVWAWRPGRARRYAPHIDRLLVLFPFELPIWREANVDVVHVGHPLADEISAPRPWSEADARVVSLLPGSRRSEVSRVFAPMLSAAERLVAEGIADRFVVPVAPGLDEALVARPVAASPIRDRIELVDGREPASRRAAIARSALALLASGTISLEVALLGRPQIVTYRVNELTWRIARPMIQLEHVGLVNLIAGRGVAPELLQKDLTVDNLVREAKRLLAPGARSSVDAELAEVRARLLGVEGGASGASARAADAVLDLVSRRSRHADS
ncbi:MAG: lipid-A-disaccharide synthase [Deltaproteobacteria bacterium]|nr:lipid-A-disaccharide synthase [Deltaproteobacteria bacterium]